MLSDGWERTAFMPCGYASPFWDGILAVLPKPLGDGVGSGLFYSSEKNITGYADAEKERRDALPVQGNTANGVCIIESRLFYGKCLCPGKGGIYEALWIPCYYGQGIWEY